MGGSYYVGGGGSKDDVDSIVVVDSSFKLYYCSLSTVCMSCFLGLLGSEVDR